MLWILLRIYNKIEFVAEECSGADKNQAPASNRSRRLARRKHQLALSSRGSDAEPLYIANLCSRGLLAKADYAELLALTARDKNNATAEMPSLSSNHL